MVYSVIDTVLGEVFGERGQPLAQYRYGLGRLVGTIDNETVSDCFKQMGECGRGKTVNARMSK
ncbi:MAG: hypothetical protein QGF39_03255, partial [Dehalococcoidia bacterium]|nr:hypothetical protein [Dehalococcoidia bacterium]